MNGKWDSGLQLSDNEITNCCTNSDTVSLDTSLSFEHCPYVQSLSTLRAKPWVMIGRGGLATTRRQPNSAPARGRGLEAWAAWVPEAEAWNFDFDGPGATFLSTSTYLLCSPQTKASSQLWGRCRLVGLVAARRSCRGRGYIPVGPNPSQGPQFPCLPSGKALRLYECECLGFE